MKTTLRQLIGHLKELIRDDEDSAVARARHFRSWQTAQPRWEKSEAMNSGLKPLKPQRLMKDLDECLPEDALIFIDVGNNTLWATHYLTATGQNCFIHNWGEFAAMGFGVAGAIGGKLAAPTRPVIAIVGDGAFGMLGMEVLTAVTYHIPVVWIVLNDGRYNAVHHGQQLLYEGRTMGTEFYRMNIAKIAEGLGAQAVSVDGPDQIQEILPNLLNSGRPAVVDVLIDPDEVPPIGSRVRALQKVFEQSQL